ncbi:hypothetical protein LIS82_27855 (plasmid) [Cytobacillus solani]|uniref:hypothetical protein n=1 Tax=Cytobacillus solani TaxID=1637975 RepID=UPI0020795D05|nr:hypothetical protein [Cytobacillus solani]USK57790.1 hypothetical protein LIS82_27855 [Cytobacillus solani]
MAIRLRTKKLLIAGAWGAAAMLLISLIVGYIFYQHTQEKEISLRKKYEDEVKEYREWAGQNETGYALKEDVVAGTKITEEMVQEIVLPPLGTAENLVHPINLEGDHFARIDMKAKTVLVDGLLYKEEMIEKDVREAEYSFIELPSKLKNEQFIDVRIQFPNGDDYILLSKKKVKEVDGLTMWTNLDEGEILSMSSAIVDAYIEGAKIYALPYVDGHVQIGSEITYPVKQNVMDLIKESPNIVSIAKLNLEKQNRQRLEAGLEAMEEEERQKLRNGEAAVKSTVEQKKAEDRINELNQLSQEQQDLVGGQTEGESNQ